ncbi:MAG: hypothetical protein GY940_17510 [bacterium]|nr:hypothetical protein [bacterium]
MKPILILLFLIACLTTCRTGFNPGTGAQPPVQLESITFDFEPRSSRFDALDIRVNWTEDIPVPEWQRGKRPWPAAYIRGRRIKVRAVFSSSSQSGRALIGADTITGGLGNISPRWVNFNNGKSNAVDFPVTGTTPEAVASFPQHWEWYRQTDPASTDGKVIIRDSVNRIYILLAEPQSPWQEIPQTEPWTEVLDYSCTLASGETTPSGASGKITRFLYKDIGGIYDRYPFYTVSSTTGNFMLTEFLSQIPDVRYVNCASLGKAQVTFANVIGAGSLYRRSEVFGRMGCVRMTGEPWQCGESYNYHSFGAIGDNIFDASLKADALRNPPGKPHVGKWMTDIPWPEYKTHVAAPNQSPAPLETYSFGIDHQEETLTVNPRLKWFKAKYHFHRWTASTQKISRGLPMPGKITPKLRQMEPLQDITGYFIPPTGGIAYGMITRADGQGKDLLRVNMIVTPSFAAAADYLISWYAETDEQFPFINPPGKEFGVDIGDVCFVQPVRGGGAAGFSGIDFIRRNVLFMLDAGGGSRRKLAAIARDLDSLLLKEKTVTHYSLLPEIPRITRFRLNKTRLRRGETTAVQLDIKNPKKLQLYHFWTLSGGGVSETNQGDFIYHAGKKGRITIRVTILNDVGLYDSQSLAVEVQ